MRPIDADAVLDRLPDDLPYKGSVKRVLMQAPTADVVEVRHGEWITERENGTSREDKCSCCNHVFFFFKPPLFDVGRNPFCPHCGAKMYGGRSESDGTEP